MRIIAILIFISCLSLIGCVLKPVTTVQDARRSVSTPSVDFLGKTFEQKVKINDKQARMTEYFLAQEAPDSWLERVEFQIYPKHPNGNKPVDFAKRAAAAFKNNHPGMEYALSPDSTSDAVYLDYFYPTTAHKETGRGFVEFNAFKFYRDAGSPFVFSFHYTKMIEGINPSRPMSDFVDDIKKARQETMQAMERLPHSR